MIVVTGGAGFIGSAIVQKLNQRGVSDILVVDDLDHEEKKKNLAVLKYAELQGKADFLKPTGNFSPKTILNTPVI